jgi:hypothetical protein
MNSIRDAALCLLDAGLSVHPVNQDKTPRTNWKEYQGRKMTPDEADREFRNGARLAVVCGSISGNLEALDFDDPATFQPFLCLLADVAPDLAEKLTVKIKTPSGGYHVIYRSVAPVKGNQKLARLAEKNQDGEDCRIETRGEGGYILAAPSPGYEVISGSLTDCPTLTPAEVDTLHQAARAFDQRHTETARPRQEKTGDTPGHQFNQATRIEDILIARGWKPAGKTTAGQGWTRPGKESGVSGVLLELTGNFWVWSSNAGPLEPWRSYDAFGLYAMFEHGGDFSAAARQLARDGYGGTVKESPVALGTVQDLPKRRLIFLPASALTGMQAPTIWHVKPYIEARTFSCLFAPPESLKTFVVVDLGLSIATGRSWHGQRVTQGNVLYLCGEGREGIGRRIKAWELFHGVRAEGFFVSNFAAQLLDHSGPKDVEAAANEIKAQHGAPALLIIDTLNRNFGAGDENSTQDMTRFVACMDRLRERLHCAVLVIHHSGLGDAGRGRGNSALRGALDFEYCLTPRRNGKTIESLELSCSKCKDHDRPPKVDFKPVVVDLGYVDEDGQQLNSLVLERTETEPERQKEKRLTPAQQISLEALQAVAGNTGGAHLEAWRREAYARGISASDKPDAKQKAFVRAVSGLLAEGRVDTRDDYYWIPGQDATNPDIVPAITVPKSVRWQ